MKINFRQPVQVQQTVSHFQDEMRHSAPRRRPYWRWFLSAGAAIAAVLLISHCWTAGRIYTYGVVEARREVVRSEVPARVASLYVASGDRVAEGDLLLVLTGEEAGVELERIDHAIPADEAERARLRELRRHNPQRLLDAQNERTRAVTAVEATRDLLARRRRAWSEAVDLAATAIRDQQRERDRLARDHARQRRAKADTELLYQLDAAVANEVADAGRRIDDLARALATADADLRSARQRRATIIVERDAELSRLDQRLRTAQASLHTVDETLAALAAVDQDDLAQRIAVLDDRLDEHRQRRAIVARRAGPTPIRAGYDAVVTEVTAHDGQDVAAGTPIAHLAARRPLWIHAWVPARYRDELGERSRVRILAPDGGEDIVGTVVQHGDIERPIPATVRPHFTDDDPSAVLVRVELDDPGELIPGNVVRVVIR